MTVDGTVTHPADGRPAATASITATVAVRGQVATESIMVTVRPSDETAAERTMRLAGQWVVPSVLASGTELPAAPAGVSVTDAAVTGNDVMLDGATIVSRASAPVPATVTATIADDSSTEKLVRRLSTPVSGGGVPVRPRLSDRHGR